MSHPFPAIRSTPAVRGALAAVLALSAFLTTGCAGHRSITAKERDQAAIQYDLGVEAMRSCDSRTALSHFQKAVQTDPELEVAHAALALVYHTSFANPDKAIEHYKKALELRPKFSEARGNLATVYQDMGRYDEAIALNQEVLDDILYRTPFIAENNLGWCLYKTGQTQNGIAHIRAAIASNPKFCLGYRNMGIIYEEQGDAEASLANFSLYAKHCPTSADAQYRLGIALMKKGDKEGAAESFAKCAVPAEATESEKVRPLTRGCRQIQDMALADECRKYLAMTRGE